MHGVVGYAREKVRTATDGGGWNTARPVAATFENSRRQACESHGPHVAMHDRGSPRNGASLRRLSGRSLSVRRRCSSVAENCVEPSGIGAMERRGPIPSNSFELKWELPGNASRRTVFGGSGGCPPLLSGGNTDFAGRIPRHTRHENGMRNELLGTLAAGEGVTRAISTPEPVAAGLVLDILAGVQPRGIPGGSTLAECALKPLRVLAILEANSITGPAKNLIEFAELAKELPDPVAVTVATFRRPRDAASDSFLEGLRTRKIPVEVIAESHAFDPSLPTRLARFVAAFRPQILQTHNVKSNFLVALRGLQRRWPWLAWHHGYTSPSTKQILYNQLDRFSLRRARMVATVTNAFLPELARAGVPGERVAIVRNAIQTHPGGARRRRDIERESILLSVGRLSREKNHAALIEAAAKLQNRDGRRARVLLVGDGPERGALAELARRRGVEVEFAGQVVDVKPFWERASVFVLPSLSEGSPNALIEAMAEALPIVATAVGGVPESTSHEREALLVPPGDSSALAAAIERLLNNPGMAIELAQAARERVEREFCPEARARKIRALYGRILEGS